MREKHLRIGRLALGRKHDPMAVGAEAVPGVHQRRIAGHAPRRAAGCRNDVQLAVGAHELPIARLHKNNPLSVRRDLGEAVAHPVPRCAFNPFRIAPFPIIERDAVKVVLNLHFQRIIGVGGHLSVFSEWVFRLGPRKHEVFAVRAPHRV